ncbi:MAG: hypothetical protein WA057_06770 [Candidatus Magasanikiibacteriota bacterium]
MLEHLFGSKTRLKLLKIFFREPDTAFFVRELSRILDVQINAIRRELELLIKSGLIKESETTDPDSKKAGATLRKYYKLNTESILYPELHALLIKAQVLGEEQFSQDLKERGGDIKLLLLTGQFTGDKRAPSDLLIVGNLKERVIDKLISGYEKDFGFEIRYTTMDEKEFAERRHIMDKFIYAMFEAENIKVVNVYSL